MSKREAVASEYMHWAKTSSRARFNLATSGLANLKLQDLQGFSKRSRNHGRDRIWLCTFG